MHKKSKTDNDMAELINIPFTRKGSVGDITVYQRGSKTYMRSRYNMTQQRRLSERQLRQCTRMNNLVRLWTSFPLGYRPVFQCRSENTTSYNLFVTYAMQAHPVYMTKQMRSEAACVVTDVAVAQGSLPEITVSHDGIAPITDIALGWLTIGTGTTVSQFARAVVENNYDYLPGDRLRYYLCKQWRLEPQGIPMVNVSCDELTLDVNDLRPLHEVVSHGEGFAQRGGRLAASREVVGGMAWVHIRHSGPDMLLSTQRLVCNNDALMQQYGSEEAFDAACRSYREK